MTKKEYTADEAFARLAAVCARGEHCEHDMVEKMRQWGLSDEDRAQVMERLVVGRFVDDARFARAFVNDKLHYTKWGRRKIEAALMMKRIDSNLIAEVLDEVDDADYVGVLRPLLRQKERTVRAASDYERRMKLTKFALSRGFTMDIIRQCMDTDYDDEFLD